MPNACLFPHTLRGHFLFAVKDSLGDIPKGPQRCLGKVSGDRKHTDIYEKEIRFTVKSPEVMSLEFRVMSLEFRVISPEMPSYVARNFIMPQQYPSIPITICRACFVSSKIIERDILLLQRACFVVNPGLKIEVYYTFTPLKERGLLHIRSSCFVSWRLKERDILTHTIYFIKMNLVSLCTSPDNIWATLLRISGFRQDDFRATWPVTRDTDITRSF